MKAASSAQKSTRHTGNTATKDEAGGSDGAAFAPPAYGIEVLDQHKLDAQPLAQPVHQLMTAGEGANTPVIQRQPASAPAYNIQLTYPPDQTEQHQQLSPADALSVLRLFAGRINAHVAGGMEGHRYLTELRREQYIVGAVSDVFGGVSLPPMSIWDAPRKHLEEARQLIKLGDIVSAARALQEIAQEVHRAEGQVSAYREGTVSGAERAVFGLQVVQVASAAAITVGTGGTAGLFLGAGYAGAQRLAGEVSATAIGLQQEIDWAGVAFDTLFALVAGKFGGQLGKSIAARLGGKITAQVASSLIVGRASGMTYAVARELFDGLRGRTQLTVEGFIDRLAEQLTLRAVFLDLVAHAAGSAAGRARPESPPSPSGQGGRPSLGVVQGGVPGPVPMRDGRVVAPPRYSPPQTNRPAAVGRGGTALAPAEQPVTMPAPKPVVPTPVPAPTPAAASGVGSKPQSNVQSGVAIAASTSTPGKPKKQQNKPTGLTPEYDDAIPMVWYKHRSYYPSPIILDGHPYEMDEPTRLPHSEDIGILPEYMPDENKPAMMLLPEEPHPNRRRQFRNTLRDYGFDWGPYEADHVQDTQWGGHDIYNNLWPMESSANESAGATQNQTQIVTWYPSYDTPQPLTMSIQKGKNLPANQRLLFRFFRIRLIRR